MSTKSFATFPMSTSMSYTARCVPCSRAPCPVLSCYSLNIAIVQHEDKSPHPVLHWMSMFL